MSVMQIVHTADVPLLEAWRRVTDWERHGAQVPLTRTTVATAPPTRVGTRFTARTGLGPVGFDDPMEVVAWRPPADGRPGHCRLVKHGRVVSGWAEIEVRPAPDGRGGSEVRWREELRVRGLPRAMDPLTAAAGRFLFARALAGLLREAR
ncbi:SRPBCC family protein [Streptomyces sp. NPDC093225]|uniref:SRPBCC family protein n=1 Tax=Streptomyces sp. NPDC093225 TaxID=3366034 RepID=UPI003812BBF4